MAHLFELTVDITDGTTAYVTNYLLNERLITKSGQSFGYDHTNRTVLVQVVVPNKSKFKRWLKRRLNNRDSFDPIDLVKAYRPAGPEPGVSGKGENIVRRAREINYKRGQENIKKPS